MIPDWSNIQGSTHVPNMVVIGSNKAIHRKHFDGILDFVDLHLLLGEGNCALNFLQKNCAVN
jgi:hypothetical protein